MYLQHFGLDPSPFTCQPAPDVFFAQAGRKNILKALRHDLQQEHTAMLLTGPQGSGKTIFCRLIQHRLDGSSYKVIFLNNPVGSFEALLRQVCEQLGMAATDTAQDITATLQALLQDQQKQGQRVLLLIDEAEKMFLAALERLFRLLNEVNTTYGMQVLLAGQPGLHTSIEQLSGYCEDVKIVSTYELTSFSEEETAAYLAYRLRTAKSTKGKNNAVFSEKAVEEITRLGQGIPGLMDGIAEASLEKAAASKADTVQPGHVTLPERPQTDSVPPDESKDKERGKALLLFLALILLLILLFFARPSLFSTQQEAVQEFLQPPAPLSPEHTEISIQVPEEEETALPFLVEEDAETHENLAENTSSLEEEEKPSLLSLPVPQRPDFRKKEEEKGAGNDDNVTDTPGGESEPKQEEEPVQKNPSDDPEQSSEAAEQEPEETIPVLSPEELKQPVQASSSSSDDTNPSITAKKLPVIQPASIIELTPGMKKTRPLGSKNDLKTSSPETESNSTDTDPPKQKTLPPVASAQRVTPTARREDIQPPKITITPISPPSQAIKADQLFARYLGAGSQWTAEEYRDKFTVQLLVLSSDNVVENIKDMIIRDEYQEHRRKLHILRRNTLPPTLFVCYGVYGSFDEARNAKNAMPLFLRKHHPYALSIPDVLAKARD
jgi:type II secretory pathway predicted ATPase ExeA